MIFPLLRRNLFEPLVLLKSKSPRLKYWRHLEETQYYPLQKLTEIQWQRLQKLWNFLWQNNAFYRKRFMDAGLTRDSLQSLDDISKLPILTKKEIRENTDRMISDGFKKENLLHFKTGGSTGKALDIFITEECSELRNACARRHDRWSGWEPGEPIAAVWGNPKLPTTLKDKLLDFLVQPVIYLDTMHVNEESVLAFAKTWQKTRPTLLFGHAHSLFILAQYVDQIGIDTIHPKGVISTSMMLLPHERKTIESVFGVKVIDRYGCEEVSLIACECDRHEGMHLNIEHLVIEFLKDDNSRAKPGEAGHIVITDLMNYSMPFVRYMVEDIGIPSDHVCSCGRGLPLMEKVIGRTADFLIKQDGTKVAGISLIENTLTKFPGIDQMQIIQETIDRLKINVVPGKNYSSYTQQALESYLQQVFGINVEILIRQVSQIKTEKSGKYRFSICRVG